MEGPDQLNKAKQRPREGSLGSQGSKWLTSGKWRVLGIEEAPGTDPPWVGC